MARRRDLYGDKQFRFVAIKRSSLEELHASLGRINNQFASMGAELRGAHITMVAWLNERALRNLDDYTKAGGRPQKKEAVLRNVLKNDRISTVNQKGFRWGEVSKLSASGAGAYWRGIEQGSNVFVGRRYRVLWFRGFGPGGVPLPPSKGRYPKDAKMRIFSEDDEDAVFTRITRPIRASYFLSNAAREFEGRGIYETEIERASATWRRILAEARRSGRTVSAVRRGTA